MHASAPGRKAYLFVIRGAVDVNGHSLRSGDQGRVEGEPELRIRATEDAELMLLDLPE
jgi:redox-sensitive bicupin YhaK (pirin superfamily)